jgi:amino acid transporter
MRPGPLRDIAPKSPSGTLTLKRSAIADLQRNLGLLEAVGLSVATIAPTLAMAFNVSLAVQFAGPAAPLAFVIGTILVLIVGLSFIAWSRRMALAGSAYGYITQAFGRRWGFIAGWALLLTYLAYGAGTSALVGNFIEAAARTSGLGGPSLWMSVSVAAVLCATFLARRNMRLAGRLMLILEGLSLLAVTVLSIVIIAKISALHSLSTRPFTPSPAYHGWAGVGYALVFAVLSFGGFEAAATLGEETNHPHRNIPLAILGALLLAGMLYVVISYAQVIGFGLQNADALANDAAPLDTLAVRYTSRSFAVVLDLAAALGGFSCVLGALSAAGRMLYALGRAGLAPNRCHGALESAILVSGAACLLCLLVWAPRTGPRAYYGALGTVGTLALILVYMGVAWAQAKEAATRRRGVGCTVGLAGALLLVWPLYNSVYPVPAYPDNLWPLLLLGWLACGGLLLRLRPELAKRKLPEMVQPENDQFDVA